MAQSKPWALITGASSGLGAEFSRQLAKKGYNLIIVARREDRLEALKEEILKDYSIDIAVYGLDLSLVGSALKCFQLATENNRNISLLINNAGCGFYQRFHKSNLEDIRMVNSLNVATLTELTHCFIPHMLKHKIPSYVANIASIAGHFPVPKYAIYSATKTYVQTFTQILQSEYVGSNISFTTISPGPTISEFAERSGQQPLTKPRFGVLATAPVIEESLKALFNKNPSNIPGTLNKFIVAISKCIPSRTMAGLTQSAMRFKGKSQLSK
ncbi:SDR family NAD(P)-dependent oxidoreductase [Bacteriovoracaceae bacterium]|nr:SDR family NAD(P)-dependent oxidoreductase [Bacteriovoracaceae bacterium]